MITSNIIAPLRIGAGDGGDLFEFNYVLYRAVNPAPSRRAPTPTSITASLFEAGGQLFTEGKLHGRQFVKVGACAEAAPL